jgi:hypothetical protein
MERFEFRECRQQLYAASFHQPVELDSGQHFRHPGQRHYQLDQRHQRLQQPLLPGSLAMNLSESESI